MDGRSGGSKTEVGVPRIALREASGGRLAPGPRGSIALGSLLDVRRDRLGFLRRIVREHGDIVRFRMGPRTVYVINHPDYVQHVLKDNHQNYGVGIGLSHARPFLGNGLLTSEGTDWARQRRAVGSVFQSSSIPFVFPLIVRCVQEMLDRWAGRAERRQDFDIFGEMQEFALRTLGFALFSVDLASDSPEIQEALKVAIEEAMHRMTTLFQLPLAIPSRRNVRFCRAIAVLNTFTDTLIEGRRRSGGRDRDLLSVLTQSGSDLNGDVLSDREVRDQVMTFMLAGYETTACALAWTWYLLLRNPQVNRSVREEVDRVLAGKEPTLDAVRALEYTSMAVDESLRLFPPVWMIPRKSIGSDRFGDYPIPPNTDVLISPYVMHRHPSFWDNAELFDPTRFLPERTVERLPYTYIPFGAGPRFCVGAGLSKIEILLVIAMVTQRFDLGIASTSEAVPDPLLALRPRGQIRVSIRDR